MQGKSQFLQAYIDQFWQKEVLPTLIDYIRIPCVSQVFDHDWQANGYIQQAMDLLCHWSEKHKLPNMQIELHQLPGRSPCLMIELPGELDKTILLYGHMDKQPEMTGWQEGLGPWQPVVKQNRLYGRGGADDGYSLFAALTALKALHEQKIPRARCIILIEASEESGSVDLPFHVAALQEKIGKPDLVICLDSGCGNYEQLWCTTSLRGNITAKVSVQILEEGVHSGAASGVVPSSFRIMRQLLSRIEDENTGEIKLAELHTKIPTDRKGEVEHVVEVLGKRIWQEFPWVEGAQPVSENLTELLQSLWWRASLSVTGVADIPTVEQGGNVLRPKTSLKLSLRIPPTCDIHLAEKALKKALTENVPYKAKVNLEFATLSPGWNSPTMSTQLKRSVNEASEVFFGKPAVYWGEGGSIPFMGMLGEKFPEAQFVITGVLGPHSNAHGPNEFLDIVTAQKITACIAKIIADHYQLLIS